MNKLLIGILAVFLLTSSAMADETFICTQGQQERVISIVYASQSDQVPCEVRYQKEGVTQTLWRSEQEIGYCEEKAEKFIEKQVNWGWHCSKQASSVSPS